MTAIFVLLGLLCLSCWVVCTMDDANTNLFEPGDEE